MLVSVVYSIKDRTFDTDYIYVHTHKFNFVIPFTLISIYQIFLFMLIHLILFMLIQLINRHVKIFLKPCVSVSFSLHF